MQTLHRDIHSAAPGLPSLKTAPAPMLAQVFAQLRESVVITDADLDGSGPFIVYTNPAFARMSGYTAEEVLGKNPRFMQGPKTTRKTLDRLRAALERGEAFQGEDINYRKDGTEFFIDWYIEPLRDASGRVTHFVAVQNDVTERRLAEAALRARDEQMRMVVSNAPLVLFRLDEKGVFTLSEGKGLEAAGLRPGEVLGRSIFDICAGSPDILGNVRRALAGETIRAEAEFGGAVFETFYTPLRDAAGGCSGVVGVATDVTEFRRSENARAQAEADYRSIFENAVEGIFQTTPEGRYLKANPALARMYGYESPAELVENLTRIDRQLYVQPGRREEFAARLREQGVVAGFESEIFRRDGSTIWISEHAREVRNESGRTLFYEGTVEDITRRKELEAQFLQAQRMESIGMLASGIAHDLNNVLAPILIGSDFLRAKMPDSESRDLVDMLETGAQRGANLVKQILSFARGITGEKTLVQLRHILTEIANMAKQTFPKRITIRNNAGRELWPVMSDTTQLHQVLLNLCVNARDAIADSGMIVISAENLHLREPLRVTTHELAPGHYVVVKITDSGSGIPPAVMGKIFEPFFTTKPIGKGTGLGLSTVIAIVKNHGGGVAVESVPGQGTAFRIFLPAVADSCGADAAAARLPVPQGQGETVLVVDDEGAILDITRETLQSFGYRAVLASGGQEALAIYACGGIDVALIDLMMPGFNGPQAIAAMRGLNPAAKIITVSGHSIEEAQAATPGVDAFLTKPYTVDELLRTLHRVLWAR